MAFRLLSFGQMQMRLRRFRILKTPVSSPGAESARLMNGRPTDAGPPYASSLFSPALSVARNCAHFTRNTTDKYLIPPLQGGSACQRRVRFPSKVCASPRPRISSPQNWGRRGAPGARISTPETRLQHTSNRTDKNLKNYATPSHIKKMERAFFRPASRESFSKRV